jgi:hypothetical protein
MKDSNVKPRKQDCHIVDQTTKDNTSSLGLCLIILGVVWFAFQAFILIGAKFILGPRPMPTTNTIESMPTSLNTFTGTLAFFLDALSKDYHYSTFSVLSLATILVWVYINWLCFKFFIHN